ncbi:MAG: XRE family transcriptional regulator [Actinomycetota bacterium]|jgi:DNA-binding transcriptional regulator YiaG|nr:XRE family transcriptional regulator [Actinomycetota bacterium]
MSNTSTRKEVTMVNGNWKNTKEIEAELIARGTLTEETVAAETARLKQRQRAYRLYEIRKAESLRQADIAKVMNVSQRRVSAIERGDISKTELGTIRSYVEALGGKVEVIANFGDERLVVG